MTERPGRTRGLSSLIPQPTATSRYFQTVGSVSCSSVTTTQRLTWPFCHRGRTLQTLINNLHHSGEEVKNYVSASVALRIEDGSTRFFSSNSLSEADEPIIYARYENEITKLRNATFYKSFLVMKVLNNFLLSSIHPAGENAQPELPRPRNQCLRCLDGSANPRRSVTSS